MPPRSPEIDAIHAALAPPARRALDAIRRAVHAAAPGAEECLAYGMPAVRYEGKPLVAWRATAKHCAFHPLSGRTVADCADLLAGFDTSPGTVRFTADGGLPKEIIARMVALRIAENRTLGAAKGAKRAPAKGATRAPATRAKRAPATRAKRTPATAAKRTPAKGAKHAPATAATRTPAKGPARRPRKAAPRRGA